MTIAALKRRVDALDIQGIAVSSVTKTKDTILTLNKQQMMEGRLSTGELITPSYYDDPYFKTPEAAKKYSDWKDRITPNDKRPSGTPNLFITGTYHEGISVNVQDLSVKFEASFLGYEISKKYGENVYGLSIPFRVDYIKDALRPAFLKEVKQAIGL